MEDEIIDGDEPSEWFWSRMNTPSNRVLILIMILLGGYVAWGKFRQRLFPLPPLYPKPYMVVYGRDSCPYCRAMKEELDDRNISYVYKVIDDPAVRDEVNVRLEYCGIDSSDFGLPVVDVNAVMLVGPTPAEVIRHYGS